VSNGGDSWSSSIGTIGSNWSSVSNSNWSLGNSVDWGSVSGHNSLGGVGLNCLVVDVGGLNNLLDWVDLVWGGDRDGSWHWDLVWLGNLLLNNDLTGNSPGDSDGNLNVVLVDLDLGDDVGDLGGDPGVRSDWGGNPGLGDGVSWGGTGWDWSWRDDSIGCWGSGDGWGRQGSGLHQVLGSSGSVRDSGLGDVLNSGNSVLVASDN
jgi:hypothetical protein